MVGGEEEVFNTFKPVLLAMGSSAVRCGGIGAGNTTKLANQIIVACNIQALAEALHSDAVKNYIAENFDGAVIAVD